MKVNENSENWQCDVSKNFFVKKPQWQKKITGGPSPTVQRKTNVRLVKEEVGGPEIQNL